MRQPLGALVLGAWMPECRRRGQKGVNSHAIPVPHCLHTLSHSIFIATAWHSDILLLDKEACFRKVEWPTQVRPTGSRKVVEPNPNLYCFKAHALSLTACNLLPYPHGKPPTGRKSHHALLCKYHTRETSQLSIHFQVHPTHQISIEDRNFGWIVTGFWNPVFTGWHTSGILM